MVGPIIDEPAQEYEGKIIVGKTCRRKPRDTPSFWGTQYPYHLLFFNKEGEMVKKLEMHKATSKKPLMPYCSKYFLRGK